MLPPGFIPSLYNPLDYINDIAGLTITEGDLRYNRKYGINYTSDLYITGNIYQNGNIISLAGLEYVTGITPGTAIGSKALVLDSNLDISGIRNLSCTTNLTVTNGTTPLLLSNTSSSSTFRCTIQSSGGHIDIGSFTNNDFSLNSNNIRRLTISNTGNINIVTGTLSMGGSTIFDSSRNCTATSLIIPNANNDVITISNTTNSAAIPRIRFIGNVESFELGIRNSTASTPNTFYLWDNTANAFRLTIDEVGNFNIPSHNGVDIGLRLGGTLVTASASELNYVDVVAGTAAASKALVLDSNRDIINIRNLTATNLTGTLQTAAQLNVTSVGTLTSLNTLSLSINSIAVNSTATELNYLSGVTPGTIAASKAIVVDGSSNVNSILRLTKAISNTQMVFTNGTSTASVYHFNNGGLFIGTTSSNDFVLQSSGTGRCTLEAAGPFNIQGGLKISGTSVTSTAAEINYLDLTTGPGTAEASKCLVLDSSKQILGITKMNIGNNSVIGGRDFNILNNAANAGFRVGSNETLGNCCTFQWSYVGDNSASNRFGIDFFGVSNQFCLLNNGNVGIGLSAPAYKLDVSGSLNCTTLNINSTLVTSTAAELNYNDLTTGPGTAEASKTLVLDSNRDIYNVRRIGCSGWLDPTNDASELYKGVIRMNSQSQGKGIEIYDTQFHGSDMPVLNLLPANSEYPIYMNFYNLNRGNFRFYQVDNGSALGAGMNIKYFRSAFSALNTNCLNIRAPNDEIQIMVNDYNTSNPNTVFHPSNWVSDSQPNYTTTDFKAIFCRSVLMKKSLMLSTSTSSTLDPSAQCCITGSATYVDGSYNKVLRLLGANASPVELQIQCASGSNATSTNAVWIGCVSNNDLRFGNNNATRAIIDTNGRLGVGTNTPSCGLDIATGENSVTTTINIAINTYSLSIVTGSVTNLGGGPVSVNMCGRFRGSIWVQDKIYATSDRRLKKDIKPLDFTLEHYSKLNPVSYKWKNTEKIMLGLIAQECKDICGEAITAVENENMKKETEDDPEGYQLTVDYNCINMMNVVAIKKLISENDNLKQELNEMKKIIDLITNYSPLKKYLSKNIEE